ncbi:PEP-CTERM sorting domain-containing protein [Streptomyces sp. NPDC001401]|uniref:PEP-CTERM sorting domain-containing protein n=1 Tax=Streptomyces sp. NPDC001401 TaxID=3364570 RepID=UPI00368DD5B1
MRVRTPEPSSVGGLLIAAWLATRRPWPTFTAPSKPLPVAMPAMAPMVGTISSSRFSVA